MHSFDERPTLQAFALDLTYIPERRFVGVRGSNTLIHDRSDTPVRSVLLEKSPLLQLAQVTADRRMKIETDRSGRLVALTFDVALERGTRAIVNFKGSISAANTFDHVARSLLLSRAFFLTSAHLLPMPRSPECFDAPGRPAEPARCDAGENYLLTDGARGHMSVSVPRGLRVVSIGEAAVTSTGSSSRFDVDIDGTRLTTLNEATAYAGTVVINEKFLRTRAAGSAESSGVAKLVIAHELAHQWWVTRSSRPVHPDVSSSSSRSHSSRHTPSSTGKASFLATPPWRANKGATSGRAPVPG